MSLSASRLVGKILVCVLGVTVGLASPCPAQVRVRIGPRQPKKGGNKKQPGLQRYLTKTDAEIESMIQEYSQMRREPITFSSNLILAYGTIIEKVPEDVLLAYVDALKEAGVQRIDINPSVTSDNDSEAQAKYDAVIKRIRSDGLKLALNPEYEQPNQSGITFAAYQQQAEKMYAEWAARYQPDEFVLVHEPTTMAARMHVQITPQQWRAFIEATAQVVKRASPGTRIGAGAFAGMSNREVVFLRAFAKIPELEFLTIDNYVGSKPATDRMDQMTEIAHEAHKPVYMEETWRPHYVKPGTQHKQGTSIESESAIGFGFEGFQSLDVKWLRAMALYAATHGMETMTPFQTRCFFTYVEDPPYDGPGYDEKVERAVRDKKRTKTFSAFQQYTREFGKN